MPQDKRLHFIAGVVIAILFGIVHPAIGFSAALLAGVLKECYDYFDYGSYDEKDMLFTWAGGLAGSLISLFVQIVILERVI